VDPRPRTESQRTSFTNNFCVDQVLMQIKLTAFDRFGKKLKPEMKVKDKTNLNKRHNNNLTNYCFPEKHMQRFFFGAVLHDSNNNWPKHN
jgi:hypothetical protein